MADDGIGMEVGGGIAFPAGPSTRVRFLTSILVSTRWRFELKGSRD